MCRVLIYLGKQAVHPYDLLYGPDNSLIHQSYDPKLMRSIQNLAGFGMLAWNFKQKTDAPYYYRCLDLPFFDKNLENLSKRIDCNCILAHVRGVDYRTSENVVRPNIHPFKFLNYKLALAHNGSIADLNLLKPSLIKHLKQEIFAQISGTTDSEWIYALLMSQFDDPTSDISLDEASDALVKTLQIIRDIRMKLKIRKASPANLFISNGSFVIVTRFVYDYGLHTDQVEKAFLEYHTLWFTYGEHYGVRDGIYKMHGHTKRSNIIFASEPLTADRVTWLELPEYSLSKAWMENNEVILRTMQLDV